jgi:serine/threonine-protein kinase RCK2
LDSPLLSAARGGRAEGRSPGVAVLKEAFDVTYAVHRMEEEGARRRKYNGRGGAGTRGFLNNLNEEDEDEDANAYRARQLDSSKRTQDTSLTAGRAGQRDRGHRKGPSQGGTKAFSLDMDGATLLERRHRRRAGEGSPLAKGVMAGTPADMGMTPMSTVPEDSGLPPGSPMHY